MKREQNEMTTLTPSSNRIVQTVCVYCGSGVGTDPAFAQQAYAFGKSLAQHNVGLVYGGGGLGLMGTVARGCAENGGAVTGIIPQFLVQREHMFEGAAENIITEDMHERKKLMYERADAFVALPGGIGTLEELVEQLTWSQLGQHKKPIAVLNTKGFWDPMLHLIQHMRQFAFIREGLEVDFIIENDALQLLNRLEISAQKAQRQNYTEDNGFEVEKF